MTRETPILRGVCVVLRPYRLGFSEPELERVFAWATDDGLLDLAGGVTLAMSLDRFRTLFLAQLPYRNGDREEQFAVLTGSGRLIGRTGLFGLSRGATSAELGIVIGERDVWGRGYGQDAVGTLVDFGFASLGLSHVVVHTFPHNVRARRAFHAVGFEDAGESVAFDLDRGGLPARAMVLTAACREAARTSPRAPFPVSGDGARCPGADARLSRSRDAELRA